MSGFWRKEFVPTWLIKLYDHDHAIGVKIVADGRLAFVTPLEPLTEGRDLIGRGEWIRTSDLTVPNEAGYENLTN